jgi:hypothetical protein
LNGEHVTTTPSRQMWDIILGIYIKWHYRHYNLRSSHCPCWYYWEGNKRYKVEVIFNGMIHLWSFTQGTAHASTTVILKGK